MTISGTLSSILVSAALLSVAAPVVAQQSTPQSPVQQSVAPMSQGYKHHHGPEQETRMLTRRLNLTPDQAAQVEPIFAAQREQMRTLRTSGTSDPTALVEQRKSIAKSTHEKIAAVLTPEQRQQWQTMRAERHHHRMDQFPADNAPAPTV